VTAIKRVFAANLFTLLVFVMLSVAGSVDLRSHLLPRLSVSSLPSPMHSGSSWPETRQAEMDEFRTVRAWTIAAQGISLLLCAMLCGLSFVIRNIAKREVISREEAERQLERERRDLEARVEDRTQELRHEVEDRRRAEELIRGQKQVLEMMAAPEAHTTEDILREITSTLAAQRRTWECSLHLVEPDGKTLRLAASSAVNEKLARYLVSIGTDFADAPESRACSLDQTHVVKKMSEVRRPWSELLVANGIYSAWSVPFRAEASTEVAGTLTVYSRLHDGPSPRDLEAVESGARLAALVIGYRRIHSELVCNAYQDALTGLPNRRAGERAIEEAIELAERRGESVGVLWIDLDRFKSVNDHYGHGAGDLVLRTVANRLRNHPLTAGRVARMGGDEFLVLIAGAGEPVDLVEAARQLEQAIAEPIQSGQARIAVRASIGVCSFPRDGRTIEALERNADFAMYRAKAEGSGSCSYSTDMSEDADEKLMLEQALGVAIEQNFLSVAYQPIYASDGSLTGFESLARFHHPVLGQVSPARFIPIAEETRQIVPIGTWVLRQACTQLKAWHDAGYPPVHVAVNISALQFAREDFAETVAGILAECRLSPEHVILELTESVVMEDYGAVVRQMTLLKELGVRIAMDDFGTGYSSLSYIHKLPIDVVKIDRSFIERLAERDGTRPIVEAVIAMAGHLGLMVVAEGVETPEQQQILRMAGCDGFQGFLFARPLPPLDAEKCLAQGSTKAISTTPALVVRRRRTVA
jgi:diguanylate cyclase (GGDEF)-like protein